MIKEFLCKTGIHWMSNHKSYFTDCVSGMPVLIAVCTCGREWMVDNLFPLAIFKVETLMSKEKREKQKCQK